MSILKQKEFVDSVYRYFNAFDIKNTRKQEALTIRQSLVIFLYYHREMPYQKVAKLLNTTHATCLNAEKRYYE